MTHHCPSYPCPTCHPKAYPGYDKAEAEGFPEFVAIILGIAIITVLIVAAVA